MKLQRIKLQNFRCYQEPIVVEFDDLTTLIGKNDIGKSTILEALEIFFNNDVVKIEQNDVCICSESKVVTITCDFTNLPNKIILDDSAETNLAEEYLTIAQDTIRIQKEFDCSKQKITEEIFLIAKHPVNVGFVGLLNLKEKDLQKIIKEKGLSSPLKGNPIMRKAIWTLCPDLRLEETKIPITKGKEDVARIWDGIKCLLPTYALFQCDRNSRDTDDEVQNPLKIAIQTALHEAQNEIEEIKNKVRERAMEIANNTHDVMMQLDKSLASSLSPKFTDATMAKWMGLFSVSMNTNDGIPLNKRGSGIRRLVLVSFFKAETERKSKKTDTIYAIEEPETSLHPNYQKLIIHSFYELSQQDNCQVILTTHSPNLAKELPCSSIRFITRVNDVPKVCWGENILDDVAETLGIFPDVDASVQVMLCVEGPTDVIAMRSLCRCVHSKFPDVVDIENDKRIVILPLGGSTLKHWVAEQYLQKMNCKEVHIYDNDVATYKKSIDAVNARNDGSWGVLTHKREIENYLHPMAIKEAYGIDIDTSQDGVPALFGREYAKRRGWSSCNESNAKGKLSTVFEQHMTYERLSDIDSDGEVKGWFERISKMLR